MAEGPMQFTRPCPRCQGHGQVGGHCGACAGSGQVMETERVRVTIPPGVRDRSRVRVAGKGEPGPNGGPPGDLFLRVRINPHIFLRREGDDLYMDVPVTVHEAMAGGHITVPTADGPVKVKVPPQSQSGQTLKLKGKGAPAPKSKKRGDLLLKLVVKVPQTDDGEILAAAEKMERLYPGDPRGHIRL